MPPTKFQVKNSSFLQRSCFASSFLQLTLKIKNKNYFFLHIFQNPHSSEITHFFYRIISTSFKCFFGNGIHLIFCQLYDFPLLQIEKLREYVVAFNFTTKKVMSMLSSLSTVSNSKVFWSSIYVNLLKHNIMIIIHLFHSESGIVLIFCWFNKQAKVRRRISFV